MKLQHTSGALIEVGQVGEGIGCYVDAHSTYSKKDWQRVPEERWEKEVLVLKVTDDGAWLIFGALQLELPKLGEGLRYGILGSSNLCVERRVEG